MSPRIPQMIMTFEWEQWSVFRITVFRESEGTSLVVILYPFCSAVVDIECSPAAPCTDLTFSNINVAVPSDHLPEYRCANVASIARLAGCN